MSPLNPSQVHILQALANNPGGLNRAGLAAVVGSGVSLTGDNLGPVSDDAIDQGSCPDSLRARGLVGVQELEGEPVLYYITAEGKRWAARSAARSKMSDSQKVPNRVLDAAVLAVKKNKAYGLELYSVEDIQEVRELCASVELEAGGDMNEVVEKYANITDDNLRLQMTNRRKQGAYSDKDAKVKADLKKLASLIKRYGVEISEESEIALDELCDNHDLPPISEMGD